MTIFASSDQRAAFRWVVVLLAVLSAFTFLPIAAPLVLAAWTASFARPLLTRVAKATGGRDRAAGAIVVALVTIVLIPPAFGIVALSRDAVGLGRTVMRSEGARDALLAMVSNGDNAPAPDASPLSLLRAPDKIFALLQEHGATAATIAGDVAGMATSVILGLFVFFYAVYVFLVNGAAQYKWLEDHAPLPLTHTRRLAGAFIETGRGLFVGVGLTGLAQGLVATVCYIALGVPRALVLGLLTCALSLVPSVGTALVWVPVAIGLALSGRTGAAAIMAGVGVGVISLIDNVLRPVFSRFGNLKLSTFVLLLALFGGIGAFGAWGLFLGPLAARMLKEALEIARDERARSGESVAPAPSTQDAAPEA